MLLRTNGNAKKMLELVKQQCRISTDEDDALLVHYLEASKMLAEAFMSRKIYDSQADIDNANDADGILNNAQIKQAILMVIAHWYEHREAVATGISSKAVELGFRALLQPFRMMGL